MSNEEAENVPRRLRRYYRRGEIPPQDPEKNWASAEKEQSPVERHRKTLEGALKEKNSRVAEQELRKFREKFRRLPKESEFDEIAENIASQVKSEANGVVSEKPAAKMRERQGKNAKSANEVQQVPERKVQQEQKKPADAKKKQSMEELLSGFSGSGVPEDEGKQNDEMSFEDSLGLDSEDLKKSVGEFGDEDSENILKESDAKDISCPNCRSKADHIIFCPNCGAAFCAHCAKAIKDAGDKVNYTCPKCGTEFKAKKT